MPNSEWVKGGGMGGHSGTLGLGGGGSMDITPCRMTGLSLHSRAYTGLYRQRGDLSEEVEDGAAVAVGVLAHHRLDAGRRRLLQIFQGRDPPCQNVFGS